MKKLIFGASAAALLGACAMTNEPAQVTASATQPVVAAPNAGEVENLNDLASAMIDAEKLYTEAAQMPDNDPAVRAELEALAKERGEQREYLQERIAVLGGEPDTAGEALGTGHRIFTSIRTAFADDTEVAIEEVLRGERYLVNEIGEIMTTSPSDDTVDLLTVFRDDIEVHIEELEAWDRAV